MKFKVRHTLITMMMVATIIMVWTNATQAGMLVTEQAVELRSGEIALPAHANAQIAVPTCPTCDPLMLRVDPRTRYFASAAGGPALNLQTFMETVAGTLGTDSALFIYYIAETDTVTRIVAQRAPN